MCRLTGLFGGCPSDKAEFKKIVNIAQKKVGCSVCIRDFDNVSGLCVTTRELSTFTYKFCHSPRVHSLEVVDRQRKRTISAYLRCDREEIKAKDDVETFLLVYYARQYGV
jgi:hypothetical protein